MMVTGDSTKSLAEVVAGAFEAYREGDAQAMSGLVDAMTPLLWHTARAQGLSQTQAEDVVQTTWMLLVQHAAVIKDPRAVLKWLITTSRREAWASAKKSRREDVRDVMGDDLDEQPEVVDVPEEIVVRGHDQRVLWKHFAGLPQRCQQLLRVVALAERPDYAQVAEALGMPVGSIGPTRGRCLAKLRVALVADPAWEVVS
jgi:RNA polymerase sigma factor (sigma-70 family)